MFWLHKLLLQPLSQNTKSIRPYRLKKVIDPGIAHRKDFLGDPNVEDETELEQLESDFMNVHLSHKEHLENINNERNKLKHQIIKQKYFKEQYPNFLTWNEKEQIKYLHSKNPEEWTIEMLSESFPALPQIIKRLVKAKYTKNSSKIANHDKVVQENWESFKKGKMNLPNNLEVHLKKFADRSNRFMPLEKLNSKKEIVNISKVPAVFSEIVTNYNKILKETPKNHADEIKEVNIKLQNFGIPETKFIKSQHHSNITLKNLKSRLLNKIEQGTNLTNDDKILLKSENVFKENTKLLMSTEDKILDVVEKEHKNNNKLIKTYKDYSHLVHPQWIKIPKHKMKKNCVYKLNDCYYDYDGMFLYRVPGMY